MQATTYINSINPNPVSPMTVRRCLKKAGMRSVTKKKAPLVQQRHRVARMKFALKYQYWTIEDWKWVLWSDETKILIWGSDGLQWVWKKHGEALNDQLITPTVKHGGGRIMVWGCMGWNGVGVLTEVEGNMNAQQYVDILDAGVEESVEKLGLDMDTFYFQQDNDPKHTAEHAYNWFMEQTFNVLDWPAQSPDLNPIEHLWNHVKKQLLRHPRKPTSVHDLWDCLVEEWESIPVEVCRNLIESMPRRIEAVIKAKGENTRY